MLFAQMNGSQEHPVDDASEADVLQNVACGVGPKFRGQLAVQTAPQAMGAYVTAGAAGACGMPWARSQQSEQHANTTMVNRGSGLGAILTPDQFQTGTTSPTSVPPTRFTALPISSLFPNVPVAPTGVAVAPGAGDVPLVTGSVESTPFYKKPLFWAAVAGGVGVIVVGKMILK